MKILLISANAKSVLIFRLDMLKSFLEKKYKVYVLCPPNDEVKNELEKNNIICNFIYCKRNSINPLNDLKMIKSIKKQIRQINPDKIFCYQAKAVIYGLIVANKKYETYPMIGGLGSVYRGNGFKTKCIKLIMKIQYKITLKKATNIIFQNHDDYETLLKDKIIKKSFPISFINGSGVNMKKFLYSSNYPSVCTFLFVGRLLKDKGIEEYLMASSILKERGYVCKCQLIGDIDTNPSSLTYKELKPYISNNSIEYLGYKNDVNLYLKDCSVFILPSYYEGIPKSILEAMAVGRPIITTNAPGCKETVINGQNGFLIEIKNVEQLVEKMIYFIEHPNQIEIMGKKSYEICQQKYDVNLVNKSIHKIMKL